VILPISACWVARITILSHLRPSIYHFNLFPSISVFISLLLVQKNLIQVSKNYLSPKMEGALRPRKKESERETDRTRIAKSAIYWRLSEMSLGRVIPTHQEVERCYMPGWTKVHHGQPGFILSHSKTINMSNIT
jgi:hypothetical protein